MESVVRIVVGTVSTWICTPKTSTMKHGAESMKSIILRQKMQDRVAILKQSNV